MASNNYRTAESTLLTNARIFNIQTKEKDLQNGAIVGKGDLVDGETQIYKAEKIEKGKRMYLVLNPAWDYSERLCKQNEENYINKAGIPFRAYRLEKDMKFKIGNVDLGDEVKVGTGIKYDPDNDKFVKEDSDYALKVTHIEEVGFPYCIGSLGTKTTINKEEYGYTIGGPTKKYTIEVVADLATQPGE